MSTWCGGGSGEVAYFKNISIQDKCILNGIAQIESISIGDRQEYVYNKYYKCTVVSFNENQSSKQIFAAGGASAEDEWYSIRDGCQLLAQEATFFEDEFVNSGSSNGGSVDGNIAQGGGSSYQHGIEEGLAVQEKEDGHYGYGAYREIFQSAPVEWAYRQNDNVIPVVSIFEGDGRGGAGESRNRYIYFSGGGAGYGHGADGALYLGWREDPGYGAGAASNYNNQTQQQGGEGIVCIYYHNDPI